MRTLILALCGAALLVQLAAAPALSGVAPFAAEAPHRLFTGDEQELLRLRLREAGVDPILVDGLRLDTLRCYPGRLRLKLDYGEKWGSYAQYLEPATVDRLKGFLQTHSGLFASAEARHGVPAEVLGSILMVETRLGDNTGQFRAPDLFLTLMLHEGATAPAALDSAQAREARQGGSRTRAELAELIRVKAEDRARWATKEMRSLARLIPVKDWDTLPCSFAGAIGLPQFMPTSLAAYGDDGDGNGRVELGELEDAVFSVGRYLKENGWRGRMTEEKRFKAIRRYNHSDVYARTVLKLAKAVGLPSLV
jgi:membrane-bound lytic murein transglycosylase B